MMYTKQGNFHIAKIPKGKARVVPIIAKQPYQTIREIYNSLPKKPLVLFNGIQYNFSDGKGISGLMMDNKVVYQREYGGSVMWQRKAEKDIHMNAFKPGMKMDNFIGWCDWAVESGPMLIPYHEGNMLKDFLRAKRPRTAFGWDDDHFYAVVTDQTYKDTPKAFGEHLARMGLKFALNMDGGGSSAMIFNGKQVVGGSRKIDTAFAIYVDEDMDLEPLKKENKQAPMLIIDPGHGGKDPGGGSCDLFTEKDTALKISLYQAERCNQLGIPYTLTRKQDITLENTKRTDIVKRSGAVYCFSNHVNSAFSKDARGAEVIHSIHDNGKLAGMILNELGNVGISKRRVFSRTYPGNDNKDYYFMHRDTGKVITQIIEYGFASNAEDAAFIHSNWQQLAEAPLKAYCSFHGIPYKPPTPVTADKLYRVQVGAFRSEVNAKLLADELRKKGYPATVV